MSFPGCKYRYGNQERTSLLEFKMRNGFEEILVPRFYVPLTNKGKVAMTLKLHRDLVALLPESAIHFARNLRAKWYTLRTSSGRRSSMLEWPKLKSADGPFDSSRRLQMTCHCPSLVPWL